MKSKNAKLEGLKGSWYVIDEYCSAGVTFYLWECEQHGEDVPAVLTDENLTVLDDCCFSGIQVALRDNGLLVNLPIDESEEEVAAGMDEQEDWQLSRDFE